MATAARWVWKKLLCGYSIPRWCMAVFLSLVAGTCIYVIFGPPIVKFVKSYSIHLGPSFETVVSKYDLKVPLERRDIKNNLRQFTASKSTGDKCIPGYLQKALKAFRPNVTNEEHLLLDKSYKTWKYAGDSLRTLYPPFGIGEKNIDIVDKLLDQTPDPKKADRFGKGCKKCILVASSGVSLAYELGSEIDKYDIVIRMNDAPVKGFEKYIGSRTSIRFIYPEGLLYIKDQLEQDSDLYFMVFKSADYHWLDAIVNKKKPKITPLPFELPIVPGYWYWKQVPTKLNRTAEDFRLINPHLLFKVAYEHLGIRNYPSCGGIALVYAMEYCDQLDITGFGSHADHPHHYYGFESKLYLSQKQHHSKVSQHDWNAETDYILQLLRYGVIGKDLTGLYAQQVKDKWTNVDTTS